MKEVLEDNSGLEYAFLKSGGETGILLSNLNLDVGHVSDWPQSLRTAIGIMVSSSIPMFIAWGSEKYFFFNDSFKNYLTVGDKFSDLLGRPMDKVFNSQWNNISQTINAIIDDGVFKSKDALDLTLIRNNDLSSLQLSVGYSPLYNTFNNVEGVFVTCTENASFALDDAERNKSEFASIFEDSPVGIATISLDDELVFQSANIFYCELVGRDREDLIGKPLLEALPELEGQGFDDLLREVITTGNPYIAKEVEVELFRSGTLGNIYVDLTYQVNKSEFKKANSLLVVATDVTKQVLSRRAVEESEARLKSLIAAAPAGIGLFVGRDLIVENPNQTFIDIVGKGPNIEGLPLREVMPELITEGQAYLKILDDVFTTGIPFISPASLVKIVQNGILKDNYYNISYTPIKNKSGEIDAILDIAIDVTAQVQAQHALEESEARLELLRDTVPAMIFYLDEEQRYQSYNSVFMDWYSVGEKEAVGKTVREFIGEEAYAKVLPHFEIAYTGQQEKYEMSAPSRMGADKWLSIVYTPHIINNGNVAGLIVHATDITQSKKTEMALRESESNLRAVIAAAPVAVSLFVGENLIIKNANKSFITYAGTAANPEGKMLSDVLKEDGSETFLKTVKEVYQTGRSFSASGIPGLNTKEKETHFYKVSLTPLLDGEGNIYAVLYVGSDVTSELDFIRKVEQAEAVMRSAVELAELGTWSMDVQSGVTTMSQRHADMFGFKEIVMTSEKARSVIIPADQNRVEEAFFTAQKNGTSGKYEAEYKIIHGITGREKIIHSIGQTFFDDDGKPVLINGTAQDITIQRQLQLALENEVEQRTFELETTLKKLQISNLELEKSNDALKHSNHELAQFAYVASHDLQEPLRKIQIFAGLLKEGKSSMDPETIVSKIASSSARMSLLISDLLAFSRLLNPEKSFKPVNLNMVIKDLWNDFEIAAQEKNATLIVESLPVVNASKLQMNQLFYNLMSNALKFTKAGTRAEIKINVETVPGSYLEGITNSTIVSDNYHHITFTDNGIGFEKDYENQIFEIFKRLHEQHIFPGSGIGLALCKRIVMNHQGVMYAESELNKGTKFHIFLPI
jgi:PAS domain S-box-containing protein